jgi:hypothetical protein
MRSMLDSSHPKGSIPANWNARRQPLGIGSTTFKWLASAGQEP